MNHNAIRLPTRDELKHATRCLNALGVREQILATFAKIDPSSAVCVVSDFSTPAQQDVLLVPPGVYRLSREWFRNDRIFIGLGETSDAYPILLPQGVPDENTGFVDLDVECKFSCLRLDAEAPTVLHFVFGEGVFSDHLMQVECGMNVEVVNVYK
jgi:hypothetical protein